MSPQADQRHLRTYSPPLLGDLVQCRIGLSSSEVHNQRFVIEASLPQEEVQRCGSPPVEPAYTPSVYVKGPFKKPRGARGIAPESQID